MKYCLTLLIGLLLTVQVHGQTADLLIEQILKTPPRSIEKYQPKADKPNTTYHQTGFNDAIYTDQKLLKSIDGKTIIKIELIYTTYRKSETFDQHGLNRKRLKALMATVPACVKQAEIEWVLIAQTGCTSSEMGKTFFHGVAITTREIPTKTFVATEIAFLEAVMKKEVPSYAYDAFVTNEMKAGDTSATPKAPVIKLPEFRGGEKARTDYISRNLKFPNNAQRNEDEQVNVQFIIDKTGAVQNIGFPGPVNSKVYQDEVLRFLRSMPRWNPGTVNGKAIECLVVMPVDFMSRGSVIPGPMQIYTGEAVGDADAPKFDYSQIKPSSQGKVILETLTKNKWKNAGIVCDVTSSMAPYNAQLIDWLQGSTQKDLGILWYLFFNDGDEKRDIAKRTGSVGGLYSFKSTGFDGIMDQMLKAMHAGNGGDLEENNIEALLRAEKDCPTCESLIHIVDNLATPRDMSLADQLTKPVHVIVCGNTPVINAAYLNLARLTKGTVHFSGKDYVNLHTMEEGSTMQVGKAIFVIKNGKFTYRR